MAAGDERRADKVHLSRHGKVKRVARRLAEQPA
jgi:hypothetical protein